MNRVLKRTCITVRRHPVVRRTLRSEVLLRKHVVRGAALSIIPSTINDVAFHHTALSVQEIAHVVQDSVTLSTINTLASILMVVSKVPI
jgi:hypothetical protein